VSGYSKNLATAQAMLPYFGPIIRGELCTWETHPGQSDKFAYKVREALYIARLHQDSIRQWLENWEYGLAWDSFPSKSRTDLEQLSALAQMAGRLRIVVISPSLVEARLAKSTPEALVLTGQAPPSSGYENPGRSSVVMTSQTPATIRAAWEHQQPSNTPLHFPHANLTQVELHQVWTWATEMHLIIIEVDGALTLQPKQLDLMPFAWSPRPIEEEDVPDSEFPFKD
jgi:hypothetical protein